MKKRLISLLMVFVMLIPSGFAVAADEEIWDAEGTFGTTVSSPKMTAAMYGGSSAQIKEVGGKSGYLLSGSVWGKHSMYMNVAQGVINPSARNVCVEVEYYDDSDDGWFYIEYNSRDGKSVYTRREWLRSSMQWKTAQFIMEAPTMGDDLNGADFAVRTLSENDYSHSPVCIRSVKVKQLAETKPAAISLDIKNVGHIFFSDEEVKVGLSVTNKINTAIDTDVRFYLEDPYGREVYEQIEPISVASMTGIEKEITLGIKKFGVYTLFAEAVDEEKGYRFSASTSLSYVRRSKFKNDKFGACNHFAWASWQPERDAETLLSLMDKSGMGWTRDEILWKNFEVTKGNYKILPINESALDIAKKYGIKQLLILAYGNKLYTPRDNDVPMTDEEMEAFRNYCYNLAVQTKGRVAAFEYWNEYDHVTNTTKGADRKYYINLAKATYESVKKANPDLVTVGICSAGTGLPLIQETFDQGGYEYMDDVSYHIYPKSPEKDGVDDDTKSVRELLNKYPGGEKKKIWLTETGWTSQKYNKTDAAKWLPRDFAMQMENNMLERLFWYDMVEDGSNPADSENSFGMLESFRSAERRVPFAAKPVFATISAMNGLLGTPDYVSHTKLNNDSVYAYHYKREQDGMDTAMFWGLDPNNLLTVNLGSKDVEFFDMYGNKIEVGASGGEYTFVVDDEPIYAVGKFEKFEEGTPKLFVSETNVKAASEDDVTIRFYKTTGDKLNISASAKDGSLSTVEYNPEFVKNRAELVMHVKGNVGSSEEIALKITDDNGLEYYNGNITIEYVEGLQVSGRTRLYRDENIKRWKMELTVHSNFHGKDSKGKLYIKEPEAFSKNVIELGTIKTAQDNDVVFHLPEIAAFTSYRLKGVIKLDSGYEQEFELPIDFALAFRANKAPEIDGVISEGEYDERGRIVSNRNDQMYILKADQPWRGEADLSAETYLMWDDEYFYLASRVKDDVFSCNYAGSAMWQGDSLQFGMAYNRENVEGEASIKYTEVGIAKTLNGSEIVKYLGEMGTSMSVDGSTVVVNRDGDYTIYELKMPWSECVPEGAEIKENVEIGYSMLVNDNDNAGRRGWIEFGAGIGVYKDSSEFARIRLVK